MSMPEIASLAKVRRPVVTTWRRRHADFPLPVDGHAALPLFDARQVAEWLLRTGRASAEQVGPELSLHTLGSLASALPAKDQIAVITALICLRHLDGEPLVNGTADVIGNLRQRASRLDSKDQYLATEIFEAGDHLKGIAIAVDDLVEAAWGIAGAFERVLAERSRFGATELLVSAVAPALARLMAEISGARELAAQNASLVITDLAAGPGDLFAATARLLGPDHTPMFIGAEPDGYLARLARRRLLTLGVAEVELDIRSGDGLPDDAGDPDVIITQIPYAPGESRSAVAVLAQVNDISVRLAPGRVAVVLGPSDALVARLQPYSPAERERTRLIKAGVVEAVIQLPGGLLPFRPGYQPALWLLSSSSPLVGRVLLADVSDRSLTDDVVDDLVEDVITWRRRGYDPRAHTRVFSAQVPISDLVDPPKPLTARRPRAITGVAASAATNVSRITSIQADLADLVAAQSPTATRPITSHLVTDTLHTPSRATIGMLAARRQLTLAKGTRVREADIGREGHHKVIRPEEVLGRRRLGDLLIDRSTLAERYPHAQLTEPGDVIVTINPAVGAIVDGSGFSVVAFPARSLRITQDGREQYNPRVLAALIAASQAASRPAGAVRAAYRLEDLPLPLLLPDELRRLDALLARLDERTDQANREIELLAEMRMIATAGLSDGTLTFTNDLT